MVFPVVMYGCEIWTIKKTEHWRIDAFHLWCWRKLLRGPWAARRSNQSILKEIRLAPIKRPRKFISVQFSRSVVSDSLWPHGLQHDRLPCLSLTPGAYSNSCPLSRWCHPTISSSVVPFSCLHSVPAPGSFPLSQFFASGGLSIGVSTSVSVLPMNIQDWLPLG